MKWTPMLKLYWREMHEEQDTQDTTPRNDGWDQLEDALDRFYEAERNIDDIWQEKREVYA